MSIREMQSASPPDASDRLSGKSERGSALLSAVLFLIISTAAAVGVVALVGSASETSHSLLDSERAFYAAESAEMMSGSLPRNGGGENKDYRIDFDEDGSKLFGALVGSEDSDGRFGVQYASAGCEPGKESLYVGWAGGDKNSWDKAFARHAICATPPLYDEGVVPDGYDLRGINEAPGQLKKKIGKTADGVGVVIDNETTTGSGIDLPIGHISKYDVPYIIVDSDLELSSGSVNFENTFCFLGDLYHKQIKNLNFNVPSYIEGELKTKLKGGEHKVDKESYPKNLESKGEGFCGSLPKTSWRYARF
ncbi:hypothetical protein [Halorhodospira neutriphila]|uniref:hypothetical protein n=1 Tax=Halorhodospira neutriphila TaxID=168379 RepID=UPI001905CEFE|nr:hypothetical protein [Halorhodospira neutriphila]